MYAMLHRSKIHPAKLSRPARKPSGLPRRGEAAKDAQVKTPPDDGTDEASSARQTVTSA